MKLNNKGFTIAELMAVVILLSLLMFIMIPNVRHLIEKNNENNYKALENGIINATKILISDYRYDILIEGSCNNNTEIKNIKTIGTYQIEDSKLPVRILVSEDNLTTSKNGNIYNPKNKEQILDMDNSYVIIKYQCKNKKFTYEIESLIWN